MSSTPPGPSREPLSDAEVNLQFAYLLAELGEARSAIRFLEDARKNHDEKILQLVERTTKAETILAGSKDTIDRHSTDLNGLGKVAHTGETLGRVGLTVACSGIGVAILIYIYHQIAALLLLRTH